ncbi:MAG: SMC-Scp complex subunit ScpB [archaeon]
MDRIEKEKIMEAALFMSPKPVTLDELNEIASVNSRIDTKAMMSELKSFYDTRKSALEIVELPVGYMMRVREGYEEKVSHFAKDTMFNKSIMKTLALIAYKQPITQSLVVQYRNNKAYDHLKELLENGLIKKEPRGKTFVLTTTTKFIEYFGKEFGSGKAVLDKKNAVTGGFAKVIPNQTDAKDKLAHKVEQVMEHAVGK